MNTRCTHCSAPIAVSTDSPNAVHECEACETLTCKCGLSVYVVSPGKLSCLCGNVLELNFDSPVAQSFEAQRKI